eukprot:TRINITY_DN2114_c0_g1_i2.p1 TRINITY_DN2114_c0_g1~~TRINITY_DN2114_c0_g1_i2.p1  ORF type:complete len:1095 (+),score=275.81 TRINITY_DN2114_c0_g1_i2:114-3287(+)
MDSDSGEPPECGISHSGTLTSAYLHQRRSAEGARSDAAPGGLMGRIDRRLHVDGESIEAASLKRTAARMYIVVEVIMFFLTLQGLRVSRYVLISCIIATVVNTVVFAVLLYRRRMTQLHTDLWTWTFTLMTVTSDHATLGTLGIWPLFTLFVYEASILRASRGCLAGVIALALTWLILTSSEDMSSWGLYSIVPDQDKERYSDFTRKNQLGFTSGMSALIIRLGLFLVIAAVSLSFVQAVRQAKEQIETSVRISENVALLLSRYQVLEARAIVDSAEGQSLPVDMRAAYLQLISNLEQYKPYLPVAVLPTDSMDSGEDYGDYGSLDEESCPSQQEYSGVLEKFSGAEHQTERIVSGRPAPRGDQVCIVFTDVRGSTGLWEKAYEAMSVALRLHNQVLRELLNECNGYEVKTVGDSFMAAFDDAVAGTRFSLGAQEGLARQQWPEELPKIGWEPAELWEGLIVRCGVHVGPAERHFVPLTGRYDYFGPTVNQAARVEPQAVPGTVAVTEAVLQAIRSGDGLRALGDPQVIPIGDVSLRGLAQPVQLTLMVPQSLAGRRARVDAEVAERQRKEASEPRSPRRKSGRRLSVGSVAHGHHPSRFGDSDADSHDTNSLVGGTVAGQMHAWRANVGRTQARGYQRCTVAVCMFRPGATGASEGHAVLRRFASALCVAVDTCGGTVNTLHGLGAVLAWNLTKGCPDQELSAARAISDICRSTDTSHRSTQHNGLGQSPRRAGEPPPPPDNLVFGVGTGGVANGDVGTQTQRFVVAFGPGVELAWTLFNLASQSSISCLCADKSAGGLGGMGAYEDGPLMSATRTVDWVRSPLGDIIWVYELHPRLVLSDKHGGGLATAGMGSALWRQLLRSAAVGDTSAATDLRAAILQLLPSDDTPSRSPAPEMLPCGVKRAAHAQGVLPGESPTSVYSSCRDVSEALEKDGTSPALPRETIPDALRYGGTAAAGLRHLFHVLDIVIGLPTETQRPSVACGVELGFLGNSRRSPGAPVTTLSGVSGGGCELGSGTSGPRRPHSAQPHSVLPPGRVSRDTRDQDADEKERVPGA